MSGATEIFTVKKVGASQTGTATDTLAVEEPLEINIVFGPTEKRIKKKVSVTMRTPGNDGELAVGFLFTEGIIRTKEDVLRVTSDTLNVVVIEVREDVVPTIETLDRNFYTTSSCGVCGKASLDAVRIKSAFTPANNTSTFQADLLHTLEQKLRKSQQVFSSTGGLHASGIFDRQGNMVLVREDVGRHNALDKVIGTALMNGNLPLTTSILLLSGRISFELMQKAYMAGIPIVTAIGAPSSLAVTFAEECGMTLVGFVRENRYTIYAGQHRIVQP
ncbi:MAG: formate dehydrogenase accessory sulfurtransferase FdhD [Cyclobacteriaceae bacterium]|nr:formate dehydrogenase accessory sulfurtransferase FdhD [Cyclobacteriaceae bacterium]